MSTARKGEPGALYQQALAILGPQAGDALATVFAGRRIFVPKSAGESHPLTVTLGPIAVAKLIEELAGHHLDVPISAGRRAEILALSKLGLGPAEIQRRVKCSRRLVYLVREQERERQPSPQLTLF